MLRVDPLHESIETENKKKNEGRKEEQSDSSHELPDWLQEFTENLVDERGPSEPWRNPEHVPMDCQCSGKHGVCTFFSDGPKLRYLLEDEKNKGSCRRRAGTVVPKAEKLVI